MVCPKCSTDNPDENKFCRGCGPKLIEAGKGSMGSGGNMKRTRSRKRMQETVVSDAVNLASRVERLTKLYSASILISEQTLQRMEEKQKYDYRFLGKVQVKGKEQPTSVYEVLDGDEQENRNRKMETKQDFERGVELYFKREFAEASYCFNNIVKNNPLDRAAQLYRDRSARFIVNPPSPEWDGVENLDSK